MRPPRRISVADDRNALSQAAIPIVGLGTWKGGENEVGQAVKWAIGCGYRHIDCAACYGNEVEVGAALKESIDGGVPREDLFVTGKLWNRCDPRLDGTYLTSVHRSEHDPAHVKDALKMTLADLQLDYVDLYLIHWPQCWEHEEGKNRGFPKNEDGTLKYTATPLMETWTALEACVEEGLCKVPV